MPLCHVDLPLGPLCFKGGHNSLGGGIPWACFEPQSLFCAALSLGVSSTPPGASMSLLRQLVVATLSSAICCMAPPVSFPCASPSRGLSRLVHQLSRSQSGVGLVARPQAWPLTSLLFYALPCGMPNKTAQWLPPLQLSACVVANLQERGPISRCDCAQLVCSLGVHAGVAGAPLFRAAYSMLRGCLPQRSCSLHGFRQMGASICHGSSFALVVIACNSVVAPLSLIPHLPVEVAKDSSALYGESSGVSQQVLNSPTLRGAMLTAPWIPYVARDAHVRNVSASYSISEWSCPSISLSVVSTGGLPCRTSLPRSVLSDSMDFGGLHYAPGLGFGPVTGQAAVCHEHLAPFRPCLSLFGFSQKDAAVRFGSDIELALTTIRCSAAPQCLNSPCPVEDDVVRFASFVTYQALSQVVPDFLSLRGVVLVALRTLCLLREASLCLVSVPGSIGDPNRQPPSQAEISYADCLCFVHLACHIPAHALDRECLSSELGLGLGLHTGRDMKFHGCSALSLLCDHALGSALALRSRSALSLSGGTTVTWRFWLHLRSILCCQLSVLSPLVVAEPRLGSTLYQLSASVANLASVWFYRSLDRMGCTVHMMHFGAVLFARPPPPWWQAVRFGEASNPGPAGNSRTTLHSFWSSQSSAGAADTTPKQSSPVKGDSLKVVVANPTAVLSKEAELCALQAHVLVLSETSATAQTQLTVASSMAARGFRSFWSCPVEPHYTPAGQPESRRGCAGGTAVLSTLASHYPFAPVAEDLWGTQRMSSATVRFGVLAVRVVAVYGFPANHPDAADKNQLLFSQVLQYVSAVRGPVLVGGDFNCDLTSLPCWGAWCEAGYQELHSLYAHRFGRSLPPTCKDATAWDTLLMSPTMVSLFEGAEVHTDSHFFDAHAPVTARFTAPARPPETRRWRLPEIWMSLQPDQHRVARCYQSLSAEDAALQEARRKGDLPRAFECWGRKWEQAVHFALKEAHQADPVASPCQGLPRKCRGRCRPRTRKATQTPASSRPGRAGDFNPPDEATTVLARQRTKQVRRLETLARHLAKSLSHGLHSRDRPHLQAQWDAIRRAGGYSPSFPVWVLRVAHFHYFPVEVPDLGWLRDLCCYVRFDCQAEVTRQSRCRAALFQMRVRQDEVAGSRIGFQALRGARLPPLQALAVQEVQSLDLAQDYGHGLAAYHCSFPSAFQQEEAVLDGHSTVTVRGVVDDPAVPGTKLLLVQSPGTAPFQRGSLSQHTAAATPQELERKFQDCWFPIWNRDSRLASKDVFQWPAFMSMVPDPAPALSHALNLADLGPWQESLKKMKPGRATGVCGCAVDELRTMPPPVLADLVALFQDVLQVGQFPTHLCKATVSCVPKVASPETMADCRPITVCATIYRLFATTVTRQVLGQWAAWLPEGLKGSVPGRSSRDTALNVELDVEHALRANQPLMGFSIDLKKFFNKIPRPPVLFLLSVMGVPDDILTVWSSFLDKGDRVPLLGGHHGVPIPSSNGVFEGDPLSILAQCAVNWCMSRVLDLPGVKTSSFVDNWTYTVGSRSSFLAALHAARAFCASMALEISWPKSFGWATAPADRKWLRQSLGDALPDGQTLSLVSSVQDLGICFRFRKHLGRGAAEARFTEARARLTRLEQLPRTLRNKAHLLRLSVWPACFYGLEAHLVPDQVVAQFRTRAARALLGRRTSMSPFLALSVLFPFPLDPEAFLLVQALRTLWRVLRVMPQAGQCWLQGTVDAHLREERPIGPASSLAALLRRNDWTLSGDGVARGPGHWRVDLFSTCPAAISHAVHRAWCSRLPERLRSRNGMQQLEVPCPMATHRALRRFSAKAQRVLGLSITGAFLSPAGSAAWDVLQDPNCPCVGPCAPRNTRFWPALRLPQSEPGTLRLFSG